MKKVIIIAVAFSTALPALAFRIAREPKFDNGTIMMSANGGQCGGLTIDPIIGGNYAGEVFVKSYRYAKTLTGSVKTGKPLSDWIEVPVGGLRVGYDWAGPRPSYHYRIYCKTINAQGQSILEDCRKVVTIRNIQHNRPCVWGVAGPNARYEPLNMRIKNKNKKK